MAKGLEDIIALADPIGSVSAHWTRPTDSIFLGCACHWASSHHLREPAKCDRGCWRAVPEAGNAVILRGGSESERSNRAIHGCLVAAADRRRPA